MSHRTRTVKGNGNRALGALTSAVIGRAVVRDAAHKALESLERRQLFAAITLEEGMLVVRGASDRGNELNVAFVNNTYTATNGSERFSVAASQVTRIKIVGGERNDDVQIDPTVEIPVFVQTGDGKDTIFTAAGNDTVRAGNGHDFIDTGLGDDLVYGGNGRDRAFLGAGDDTAIGGNGSDRVFAGAGKDSVDAQSGDDRVFGEGGDDQIDAGVGQDVIDGGDGNDSLKGETTDDITTGAGTADRVERVAPPPKVDPEPTPQPNDPVTLSLINADTNQPIRGFDALSDNAAIDLAKLPTRNLNVRANIPTGNAPASVAFAVNGRQVRVENRAPFALAGDANGNFAAWTPKLGANVITARTFASTNATGAAVQTISIRVNVVDTRRVESPSIPDPTPNPTPQPPAPTYNTGATWKPSGPVNGNETVNPAAAGPQAVIDSLTGRVPVGHAVHVNALKSSLSSGTRLGARFDWDFGEPGSRFNTLRGFNAAHVYERPGEYTITLRVTDTAGKTDIATSKITIEPAKRRVYFVSETGSDANDGLSPESPLRSWDKARSLLSDNVEIRFRAGDMFNVTQTGFVNDSNVVLRSYGPGPRPVLMWTGGRGNPRFIETSRGSRDVTVRDLAFDSRFANDTDQDGVPTAIRPGGRNFSAINNEIRNIAYFLNNELKPTGVMAQDNTSPSRTGLRAYLAYVVGSDHVYIGNAVANSTREHSIRADGAYRVLIAHNDFANIAQGRAGDRSDIMKQTVTLHWGSDMYVYANKTIGGRVEVGPLGNGDGLRAENIGQRLTRVVVEGNELNFAANQRLEIDHGTDGVIIRGNRIRTTDGAGINVQAMGRYTNWPQYGSRNVRNVWVTSNNDIQGTRWVTIGRGSSNINVASANRAARTAATDGARVFAHASDISLRSFAELDASGLYELKLRAA